MTWQPFDYQNPPDGYCWLDVERPETWCDAGTDGRTIGGPTGETIRLVVLAHVYMDEEHGVQFERLMDLNHGEVRDGDTVRRFIPLTPPELGEIEEDDRPLDLTQHGYAPGSHTIYCADCQQTVTADKQSIRCWQCAMELADGF